MHMNRGFPICLARSLGFAQFVILGALLAGCSTYTVGGKTYSSPVDARKAHQQWLAKGEASAPAKGYATLPVTMVVILPDAEFILNNTLRIYPPGQPPRPLNAVELSRLSKPFKEFHVNTTRDNMESLARSFQGSAMFAEVRTTEAIPGTNELPASARPESGFLARLGPDGVELSRAPGGEWKVIANPRGTPDVWINALLEQVYAWAKPLAGQGDSAVAQTPREAPKPRRNRVPAPGSQPELVAVLDFQGIGLQAGETAVVADRFREELVKTRFFTVLDRSQMGEILDELAFQQSGCTETECAVQVGKILGVRRIIAGKITRLEQETWVVSVILVDVETSQLVHADSTRFQGKFLGLIDQPMQDLAGQIVDGLDL
jgi:hypothetical protein